MYLSMDLSPDDRPQGARPTEERQPRKEEIVCEFCLNNGSDVCKCFGQYQQ